MYIAVCDYCMRGKPVSFTSCNVRPTALHPCAFSAFLDYEQRDPFAYRQMKQEEPDVTAWERYAREEYQQLAMEEEERERQEDDDSDDYDDDNQDWDVRE